ncbi:PREDICTED: uncharacterized protein LOC104712276 [Camelina sativa]|uniref:Uncharacterized protein LOC104712276 n=1 Tax=Camelina sativa TaxID=90675 RepID=A0ABM0TJS9_CAMSA|nr:PREDICTED: uncharacterized protein LOC104712276 [Camelina sativa]
MSTSAQTMSSLFPEFAKAETGVFWDLDDCPIPKDLTPASISDNIKLALKNNGYTGKVTIVAYTSSSGGEQQINKEEFESANIKLIQPDWRWSNMNSMFKDVCMWGINHRDNRTNLLIISNEDDISYDEDFVDILVLFKKRDNNILLSHPRNASGLLLSTATSVWLWNSLSNGGNPINKTGSSFCPRCAKWNQLKKKRRINKLSSKFLATLSRTRKKTGY